MMVNKIMKYDKEMAEIFEVGTFNTEIINHQFSKSLYSSSRGDPEDFELPWKINGPRKKYTKLRLFKNQIFGKLSFLDCLNLA